MKDNKKSQKRRKHNKKAETQKSEKVLIKKGKLILKINKRGATEDQDPVT
jgi:hypothetical protein